MGWVRAGHRPLRHITFTGSASCGARHRRDFPTARLLIMSRLLRPRILVTLTLPDGPRPANPRPRLFVMVGLCGGFTTFRRQPATF